MTRKIGLGTIPEVSLRSDWRIKMITVESMMSIDKSGLQEAAKTIGKEDIAQLVEWLALKDDKIRYQAFLLLQNRVLLFDDVYPYWNIFQEKLQSDNSYQRSIGLMLIAENTKWDTDDRLEGAIDEYLECLNDEKINQSLLVFLPYAKYPKPMAPSKRPIINMVALNRLISCNYK
jgi:hypothetical protein